MDSAGRMTKQGVRDLNDFGKKKARVSEAPRPEPERQTLPPAAPAQDEPLPAVAVPSER
jgi:hypothetical protein